LKEPKGEKVPAGFVSLALQFYRPKLWITAPRFHEDKLRGNDRLGEMGPGG
jgi:hypothetical protein